MPLGIASRRSTTNPVRQALIGLTLAVLCAACATQPADPAPAEVAEPASTPPTSPTASTAAPAPSATTAAPAPTARPTTSPAPTATPAPAPSPTATPTAADLAAGAIDSASLAAVDCPDDVEHPQITCHHADLPLRLEQPDDGDRVQLLVATIDNGDPDGIGPVVYLQGGPGVASVENARRFVGTGVDLILFDQRGAGGSTPRLDCPEIDDLWLPERVAGSDVDNEAGFDAFADCVDRFGDEGIDIDHFNTTATAADVELLRQLLGYDAWSLWGISYGTRLGLTIMRDHPAGVRAAVLDSVVPFEVDFFATIPEHASRAIGALDAACDRDQCSIDHGDLLANLAELVVELETRPQAVSVTRPVSRARFDYLVTGGDVLDIVFAQLYSTRLLGSVPRQIDRYDFGGLTELVQGYATRRDPEGFDLSIGLYYATWCREEFPFHDPDLAQVAIEAQSERFGPVFGAAFADAFDADNLDRVCSIFDVKPAPAIDDQPLRSTIPTVVFAGAFDPITPPEWSRQVADALPNSTYVELPDHGHGMATRCPGQIQIDFLRDPTTELDLTCVGEIDGPSFD